MKSGNTFYEDLKLSVAENFTFLKDYGFSNFEEEQIAYEVHFLAGNDLASIDIWFEMTIATPVWVKINGYYTSLLEPDHPLDKQYTEQRAKIHDNHLAKEQYITLNIAYLKATAGLLQKYPEVLMGNTALLEANFASATAEKEQQLAAERIKNHVYTCYFTIGSGIECEEEAPSLEKLRLSLTQFNDPSIRVIQVVDCYMNPVPFPWP